MIKTFNNHTIKTSGEELQIQIRYADTPEQKSLKQQTQAARQFRSAEYEYATQAWRQGRLPYAGTTVNDDVKSNGSGNEFERYLGTNPAVSIQGQRWAQSTARPNPGRSPLGGTPYTDNGHQSANGSTGEDTHQVLPSEASGHEGKSQDATPGPMVAATTASEQR